MTTAPVSKPTPVSAGPTLVSKPTAVSAAATQPQTFVNFAAAAAAAANQLTQQKVRPPDGTAGANPTIRPQLQVCGAVK